MPRIKTTPPKTDPTRTEETIPPVGFTPEAPTYSGIPIVTDTPPGVVLLTNMETGEHADLMPDGRIETGVTDRAQVAALGEVANPPLLSETPAPSDTVRTITGLSEWGQRCEEEIAEKDATIAEQSARIAELEAEAVRVRDEVIAQYTGAIKGRDERIADLETELATAKGPRALTIADHAAGYLAITSGKSRAATWRGNVLHDVRDPDKVVGQVSPMSDGWHAVATVGTMNCSCPPFKEEAGARAWVAARCGYVVVA